MYGINVLQIIDSHYAAEQNSYEKIKKTSKGCTDIVELMAALFCTKSDFSTVYQCCKKTKVKVDKFKDKSVVLLISDLDLSEEDLEPLTSIYKECTFQSGSYKIMWVPIVEEDNEAMQKKFLDKRSEMRWYTSNSMVSKPAAQYIKRKWQFRQQTKVVVLNQQGKVVNVNAMPMIRLWGLEAFPFTESRGKELWNSQGVNWFKLVVNNKVLPGIEQSYEEKELIIMYASAEDPQIVQRIEKYLGEIDNYLGLHKVLTLISTEREQFLTRIESCLYLKMVANSDVYDPLAQELLELYTCYKQSGGFAVIGRGLRVVVSTRLMDFETVLSQHEKWLNQPQAFEDVFKAYHDEVVKRPRCHHFYIPIIVSNIPEYIKCAKCSRYMKSAVTLECCHGDQPMRPSYPTPSLGPPEFPDSAATPPEPRAQPSAVAAEPQVPAANQNGVPAATGPTTYPSQSRVPSALDEWTPRSHLGAV